MQVPRLGVNIDHLATLRQARGEQYPDLSRGAKDCFMAGASQLTIHLREDRRHIQDRDVKELHLVAKKYQRPLNLELGCDPEIIALAISEGPEWVCLVPEKREEKTTEGGLDLISSARFQKIAKSMAALREGIPQVKISLFLEAKNPILERALELGADAVEIHTGEYAKKFLTGNKEHWRQDLLEFHRAQEFLDRHQVSCHAGHGLTMASVVPLLEEKLFLEYNIGHWIVCEAIFRGLGPVVQDLQELFLKYGEGTA